MTKKAKILLTGYFQGVASGLMLYHIFHTLMS